MVKLPLEYPTNPTNTILIQQSLYAEKLDLKYRYRVLFSFVVLFIVSAFRTILEMNSNFRFGALGTILILTPWFISIAWCRSSWRAKRAKLISFAVLHQYMTVLPKNISGHYVKVQAKISHIGGGTKKHPAVIHITAIEPQGTTITVSLQKLKKQTIVYPIAVGDIVEIAGEVFTQNINNKTIAVIAAHSLLQISENQIAKKVVPAPAPTQATALNTNERPVPPIISSNRENVPPKELLSEAISDYMAKYTGERPNAASKVACIFAEAHGIARSLPQDQIRAEISKSRNSIELIALNILQNCAMSRIKPCPVEDLILHTYDDAAYDLYNAINDKKHENRFISDQQYEENKMLAVKLKMGNMF